MNQFQAGPTSTVCLDSNFLFFIDPRYGFGAVRDLSPALSFDWGRL